MKDLHFRGVDPAFETHESLNYYLNEKLNNEISADIYIKPIDVDDGVRWNIMDNTLRAYTWQRSTNLPIYFAQLRYHQDNTG